LVAKPVVALERARKYLNVAIFFLPFSVRERGHRFMLLFYNRLQTVVPQKNFFSKTLKFSLKLPIKIAVKRERTCETVLMQARSTDAKG
jgi:hypothetical protein